MQDGRTKSLDLRRSKEATTTEASLPRTPSSPVTPATPAGFFTPRKREVDKWRRNPSSSTVRLNPIHAYLRPHTVSLEQRSLPRLLTDGSAVNSARTTNGTSRENSSGNSHSARRFYEIREGFVQPDAGKS